VADDPYFKRDWQHPVSKKTGYALFQQWIELSDKRLDVAAELMGVSLRTAQRWRKAKQIPKAKAIQLEQIINGPAIEGGLWRANGIMIRQEWRPYLRTRFPKYR
jgi:hypothetical protein